MQTIILLFLSALTHASTLYFDASQAAGTERMAGVDKVQFLFTDNADSLRLCGIWIFAGGRTRKFEQHWELAGSDVRRGGKSLGSYFEGNFLAEEEVAPGKFQSLEVSRAYEKFFEYRFHHPELGFVDADGWITETPTAELTAACL
jgi:hypothetical protein